VGGTSTSGSASTRWGRSSTGWCSASSGRSGAPFLTFTDYMRAPIRLSSIMEIPAFHVMTHDSIGLGEDGPTHQPIEQLASLRARFPDSGCSVQGMPTRSPSATGW
jgi:hypothetical protein